MSFLPRRHLVVGGRMSMKKRTERQSEACEEKIFKEIFREYSMFAPTPYHPTSAAKTVAKQYRLIEIFAQMY